MFYALKDRIVNDEQHLAEMVALMGPPPKKFLERSDKCRQYWDAEGTYFAISCNRREEGELKKWLKGNWIAKTAVPDQSWAIREVHDLKERNTSCLLHWSRKSSVGFLKRGPRHRTW